MSGPAASGGEPLPRTGLALLAVVTLLWGVNWPVMKLILGSMSPWTFRALVMPASGLILLAIARGLGQSIAIPRAAWLAIAVSSLFNMTGWHVFSALGLTLLKSGDAVLIAFTMPLWTSVFSAFALGERMTARRAGALVLGLAGVGLLLGVDVRAYGASPLGALYMLAAAVSWAAGVVVLKRVDWRMPTLSLAGWQVLVGALPVIAAALAIEPGWPFHVGLDIWLWVAFVVIGPMAFCGWGFFKVVSLFPASVSAIGTLMIPVVGVLSSALALGEPLGAREVGAMALVCSGLALEMIRR